MGKTNLNASKKISDFCNFYTEAVNTYCYCKTQMQECDKLTQDILHKIELDETNCDERSKLATQLKYCRKDRRYYKDRVEELEPFVSLFSDQHSDSKATKRTMNLITNCLGAVRKQEAYHENRTYKPRIIKEDK